MDAFPLITSYYTKDTLYQLEVQNLIASCKRWGVAYEIEGIPSFGSWERNCAYKPFFLLRQLERLKRPLLWLDADAVLLQQPEILEVFSADLAVRINADLPEDHPSRVITGSVYVNATPDAQSVLTAWAKGCLEQLSQPERTVELWDQMVLRDVLRNTDARVENLSPRYTKIAGHPIDEREVKNPVIVHYQASRRYKKLINSN